MIKKFHHKNAAVQTSVAMVQMLWKHSVAINPLLLQNRHYGTFCCYKSPLLLQNRHYGTFCCYKSPLLLQNRHYGTFCCYKSPLLLQNRHYGTFCCYKSILAMVQLHGNLQLLWCKHVAKETTAAMVQTSVAMAIIHHYGAKFYCYSKRQ